LGLKGSAGRASAAGILTFGFFGILGETVEEVVVFVGVVVELVLGGGATQKVSFSIKTRSRHFMNENFEI